MRKQYTRADHRKWRRNRLSKDAPRQRAVELSQFAKYYCTTKGRAEHMFNNAKARAKRHGKSCNLTREWIKNQLELGTCAVTGIPFVFVMNGGKGHRNNPFSPSLDRIRQEGGYTKKNCRVVCWIYNRARGAFSDSAMNQMLDALIRQRQKEKG